MKIFLSIFFIIPAFLVLYAPFVFGVTRTLPRFKSGTGSTISTAGKSYSTTASVRMINGKKGVRLTLGNLQNANSVSYVLSYTTDGRSEGLAGSVNPSGQTSSSRELLFGTCSSGTCKYHSNISNAKLEITSKLKNGKTAVRRYRIKL